MAGRHPGHEAAKQGREQPGEYIDETGQLGDAKQAQPQRQHADEPDGNRHREFGHIEGGLYQGGEHGLMAEAQPLVERRGACHQKEPEPDPC